MTADQNTITIWRYRHGLSQRAAARLLGVAPNWIKRRERDETQMAARDYLTLAAVDAAMEPDDWRNCADLIIGGMEQMREAVKRQEEKGNE